MNDPRIIRLAENLLAHSVKLGEKEKLLIEVHDQGIPLAKELIRLAYEKGAFPYVQLVNAELERALMLGASEERGKWQYRWEESKYREVDAFIQIRGPLNDSEYADVPAERRQVHVRVLRPLKDILTKNSKWLVVNYPNPAMAQKANMSTEAFEDFYFDVCLVDYAKMHRALIPLKELMERTDRVRIVGPGTDLTFSIKGIPAVICSGEHNIPDGEIFTAPVRDSVNGVITFNTPSQYHGITHEGIRLVFKEGKIVEATSSNTKALNEILDTDEGARYVGEFAIGVNPYVLSPMNDILFDEKIAGSFHFTPGRAYEEADNGNRSAIHWDMVMIQRPEYGGGEIHFDDVLIRRDGRFVLEELEPLNPENLK